MYDLHTHSTCSDGACDPARLAALALEQGLRGFALTDHDTMRGIPAAQAAGKRLGVNVLAGVELSAFDPDTDRRVHLLVYLPRRPEALDGLFSRVQNSREEACLRSLQMLSDRYPIREEDARAFADGGTLFRTHILRALMERGYADRVFGELYHALFGKGGIADAPVAYIPMREAAIAARESGGVTVLAHPSVYDSASSAERLCKAGLLDGIEYDYPRRRACSIAVIDELCERYSLIRTGGTDFHGFHASPPHPIGTCRTADNIAERLIELSEKRKTT